MTKEKALKRDVRARMTKTGESYTTARHFLLDEHRSETPAEPDVGTADETTAGSTLVSHSVLHERVAEPGVSDEALQNATGKTWDEWFLILDAWDATTHTHTEIARYVAAEFGVPGWWSQNVTVGFERARGMRKVNQHLDGYSVSVSRTFGLPVERLFQSFADEVERSAWLEPELIHVRTSTENKAWRCEIIEDSSRVEVRFTAKSPEKTSITIEHQRLPDEDDVAIWRAFWKARLDKLTELVR